MQYNIKAYNVDLIVFYAKEHYYFMDRENNVIYKKLNYSAATQYAWKKYVNELTVYEVDGEHSTIFDPKYAQKLAEIFTVHLNQSSEEKGLSYNSL